MNHAAVREMFELLYGMPRPTCPHCHQPKHPEKCGPQIAYERRAYWELEDAERARALEDAARENGEFVGASNGSVDWENT